MYSIGCEKMGTRIPESIRSEVKQRWFQGESRNKIAAICGISQAATSGIIDEWKRSIGVTRAEQFRDLSIALDRHNISIAQCAQGYRTFKQLSNIGVEEDEVESFAAEIYNGCIGSGMRPQGIVSHLKELTSWTDDIRSLGIKIEEPGDDDNGSRGVPRKIHSISQIAMYLEKSKEEVKQMQLKKKQLKGECELLEAKKSSIRQETADMLKKHDMTAEKLDWYLDMKTELLVSGNSEKDFELVLKAISFLKESGYNFLAISSQYTDHKQLESSNRSLQIQNAILERKNRQYEERVKISEQMIESKSQMQWQLVKIEAMGFGLKQLTWLYNVINEITEANGFSETDGYAVKIFQDQVQRNYNPLLGFKKRIEDLKEDFNNLQIQYLCQANINAAQPYVGSSLTRLLRRGVQEDQIVKLTNLLEMHPDVIQSYLRDRRGKEEEEQHKDDDFKSTSSLSLSSSHFAPSPSLYSSSSSSPHPSQPHYSLSSSFQPQSPPTSTTAPMLQKSSSRPPRLTEPFSTATSTTMKPSADSVASSDKESNIQPFTPSPLEQPSMKVQRYSSGEATAAPEPSAPTHKVKSSQQADMKFKDDILNRDLINPYLNQTPTFYGNKISIPKSFHLGSGPSGGTQEFLRNTSEETFSQSSNQNKTPYENISALKTAPSYASRNSVLPAQESSQAVLEGESIRNRALRSSRLNSAPQIEALPVINISASGTLDGTINGIYSSSNNSDPANMPMNVLDGTFETSWTNKERGSWLLLDLGTTKKIQSVAIAWYQGDWFDYYYNISLSNDGIIFTEVKSGCSGGNSRSFQQCKLKAGYRARYIKIRVNGNNLNDMGGITQVEVLGYKSDSQVD
jgi:cell division protein FtsB